MKKDLFKVCNKFVNTKRVERLPIIKTNKRKRYYGISQCPKYVGYLQKPLWLLKPLIIMYKIESASLEVPNSDRYHKKFSERFEILKPYHYRIFN